MERMSPLETKDYKIDILIGNLGAILIIARGFHLVWRVISEGKSLLGIVFFVLYILIPSLYIFSSHLYNVKVAKLSFRIWLVWFFFFCWYGTDKFLNNFSAFWKVIFPFAFMTACMLVGLMGVVRIKEPDQTLKVIIDPRIKIPKSYHNTRVLIGSIGTTLALVSTFTLMVLIGKYFCDFVLIHWPSLEKNRVLLFYIGMAIDYYPSKILGAAIASVLTGLVELIWNLCVKLPR
jgi:hypothetical protein